ncbi:MAG: LEPR-XLL domain-containing protein [Verrucomicrobia bacterium]|nr:LEPR-XLL domain-containing protein [Verrucomicrobiota bacterium]
MLEPRILLSAEPFGLAAGLVGVMDHYESESAESLLSSDHQMSVDIGEHEEAVHDDIDSNDLFAGSDEIFAEEAVPSTDAGESPTSTEFLVTETEAVSEQSVATSSYTGTGEWAILSTAAEPEDDFHQVLIASSLPNGPPVEQPTDVLVSVTHSWIRAEGGNFSDASAWSEGVVPQNGDSVDFSDLNEGETIIFDSAEGLTLQVFDGANVVLRVLAGELSITSSATIGSLYVDGSQEGRFSFTGFGMQLGNLEASNAAVVQLGQSQSFIQVYAN